ncbi:MFS transporter [uncultured Roseobacter sp.]|uniref:MFS transporter n=1 Tax=uncultured Roseobacter sp. TaxID=114847 RepID=UPI0026133F8C|nr:MFS transporter [uncultured Roseobacter sp.]
MSSAKGISGLEFIALNAMLMALVALAINMILPAFSHMTGDFNLPDPNRIGLAVSLLYVGLAFGQILFGAWSDSVGRKLSLNIGLLVFLVGSMLSFYSSLFWVFIVGQVVQGIGLGAPRVVTIAIVRDRYNGAEMAQTISFIMVIFSLVPTISPFLGQCVIFLLGWRSLFAFFSVGALLALFWLNSSLPETHLAASRKPVSFQLLASNFSTVLKNRPAMFYAGALGVVSGAFIAYLNMSQQLFEVQHGLGTRYPLFFALMSLSLALASFLNGRLVVKLGVERLAVIGLVAMGLSSAVMATATLVTGREGSLTELSIFLAAMLFCFGLLVSNLNALAMRSLGTVAGTGASVVGAVTTFVSVPLAILVGSFYSGSSAPLVLAFGGFSAIGYCLVKLAARL